MVKLVPALVVLVVLGCQPPAPSLSLTPTTLDFGVVPFGEEVVAGLEIANWGSGQQQLERTTFVGAPGASLAEPEQLPTTLEAGEVITLDVAWSPEEADLLEGQLLLYEEAEVGPRVVRLWGTPLMPEVRLIPDMHDFGTVPLGCTVDLVVQIVNIGEAAAVVEDWWLDDFSTGGELSLIPGPPSTFTLVEGHEMAVVLHYSPVDLEPDWGQLRVETNVPGEQVGGLVAALSGTGGPGSDCVRR